jgi:hypothetical protein
VTDPENAPQVTPPDPAVIDPDNTGTAELEMERKKNMQRALRNQQAAEAVAKPILSPLEEIEKLGHKTLSIRARTRRKWARTCGVKTDNPRDKGSLGKALSKPACTASFAVNHAGHWIRQSSLPCCAAPSSRRNLPKMQAIALGLCCRAGQPVIYRSAQSFDGDRRNSDFGVRGRIGLMEQIEQVGGGFC